MIGLHLAAGGQLQARVEPAGFDHDPGTGLGTLTGIAAAGPGLELGEQRLGQCRGRRAGEQRCADRQDGEQAAEEGLFHGANVGRRRRRKDPNCKAKQPLIPAP